MNLYAVIMAGGSGTRFWPLSRAGLPKQLLRIGGEKTLLERTVERVLPLVSPETIYIVTGEDLRGLTAQAVPVIPQPNIIAEPVQRNTAACVGLAASLIAHRDPEAVLAVLPADHVIAAEDEFRELLLAAAEAARESHALVTFGIKPEYPETGYGYVEIGSEGKTHRGRKTFKAVRFHEKPNRETAEGFLATGRFAWNSGMFVFRADAVLAQIEKHLPELSKGLKSLDFDKPRKRLAEHLANVYPLLPSVSIDHGVMEKADNVLVIPADIGWSDVGSFLPLAALHDADEAGNCVLGEGVVIQGEGNVAVSRDGLVAAFGVSGLVIVHTPDVTLVCPKDKTQEIRRLVDDLRKNGLEKYL